MAKLPNKALTNVNRRAVKIGWNMIENEMMCDRTKPLSFSGMVELSERRIKCQI
jgi:hypothetical protein